MSKPASHFSRIFIEPGAGEYALGRRILERFPKAQKIEIDHYKDIFNRPRQDWRLQKTSKSLILAVRDSKFLYDGSQFASPFGHQRFFYNTQVLNCMYDCSYCYLQGMFPSGHVVVFVNTDEFMEAVTRESVEKPLYLCISYDTDLLAFEGVLGLCETWYDYLSCNKQVTVELRTKSAQKQLLKNRKPIPNLVLAWTLSPDVVVKEVEKDSPSLKARLSAIKSAVDAGWKVRICIDPVLHIEDWKTHYGQLVSSIEDSLDLEKIFQFSVGVFRMNSGYLKKIRQRNRDASVLFDDFVVEQGASTYRASVRDELTGFVRRELECSVASEKVVVW